jgi:hypothetical protein
MQEKIKTGQNIDSYCGKCKQSSEHTIMALDNETVSKVRCRSCGSTHKFKSPADAAKVRKPRKKQCAGEGAAAEIVWAAALAKAKGDGCDYRMAAHYRIGDIVNHQTFGKGIVLKLYVNKCGMLFKDGERLMASTNQ